MSTYFIATASQLPAKAIQKDIVPSKRNVMVFKAFKYRLYPSKAQHRLLEQTVETCRGWYNTCLEERKLAWELEQRKVSRYEQFARVKEYRRENSTREESKDLVHIMLQVVSVDVVAKRVLWVKARLDYEPLFSIIDGLGQDADKRFWVGQLETSKDACNIREDLGQKGMEVKIAFTMSHNTLTSVEEYVQYNEGYAF